MTKFVIAGILVVLGAVAIASGILLGVRASANYLVEGGFTLFGLAGAVFVGSVLVGLVREFRETA